MSLNFRYDGLSDTEKWTDADWQIYNALVWATTVLDIGELNSYSAKEFCARAKLMDYPTIKEGDVQVALEPKHIKKYYGLSTNVITLGRAQWIKKKFGARPRDEKFSVAESRKAHDKLCKKAEEKKSAKSK